MKRTILKIYTGILTLPYTVLYTWPRNLFLTILKLNKIAMLAWQAEEKTIYKSEERISKIEIFYHLLKWQIEYGELGRQFYNYGLDRKYLKGRDQFLGSKKFETLRDGKNNVLEDKGIHNFDYVCIVRDKFVFSRYMSCIGIPVINDLAILNGRSLLWLDSNTEFDTIDFFTNQTLKIDGFCKPVDGRKGEGAFSLKFVDGQIFVNEGEISVDQLIKKITGTYLLQERIVQHNEMRKIYPFSVNTMRIVTYYHNGSPELFLGLLRIGSNGRNIDNVSAGGIAVGIDLKSGKLFEHGFQNKFNKLKLIEAHPDTGFRFKGFTLPFFKETADLIKRSHSWMYGLHSIGWDVAITPSGPVIIEANDRWNSVLFNALNNGIKDKFIRYFSDEN